MECDMVKEIILTRNKIALIDDENYEWLNQFKWYAHRYKSKYSNKELFYAVRNVQYNNKKKTIFMHRLLMNAPNGIIVDHHDQNSLNNQKYNLRFATKGQNTTNSPKPVCYGNNKTTSQYKGVSFDKSRQKWEAYIGFGKINGKCKKTHLGRFNSEIDAALAYDKAAKIYFKEFACLNFPQLSF
jgi:hypothetical protein